MLKKSIGILNILLTLAYWIPVLIILILNYNSGDSFVHITQFLISLSFSFTILGFFGVLAFIKKLNSFLISLPLSSVAIIFIFDAIIFVKMRILIYALIFIAFAILGKLSVKIISLQNQVLIFNILFATISIFSLIALGFKWY